MSEIIERIESLEERADTTDGTIAQIQIDIEDLKQRMTEVETTVVQIMEKFDNYYTKTEIDAMITGVLNTPI
jgi:predicted  nucleic acid-binding Zn-ribbon protein